MSQTSRPSYQRTFPGLIGAMLVVVLVVVGWTGFRALTSDQKATPVRTVEWQSSVERGRAEERLVLMAPKALPEGWRATTVRYRGGTSPTWHLGMLTDEGRYVGIEEHRGDLSDLVAQYVDEEAVEGDPVEIGGEQWRTFTDEGGDYALGHEVEAEGSDIVVESYLVVGTADEEEIREFARSLEGGSIKLVG